MRLDEDSTRQQERESKVLQTREIGKLLIFMFFPSLYCFLKLFVLR